MVALNWQRWDEGMMLNEGMFTGSQGYILKPEGYCSNSVKTSPPPISSEGQSDAAAHKTLTLSLEILAGQDIPLPLGDTRPEGFHPYVKCELHVEKPSERSGAPIEGGGKVKEGEFKWRSRTMRGTEADFANEKVEFKDVSGVVEELSFLRYVKTLPGRLEHPSPMVLCKFARADGKAEVFSERQHRAQLKIFTSKHRE